MKVALVGSVIFSRRMLDVLLGEAPGEIDTVAVFGIPPEHSGRISDYADLGPAAAQAGVAYFPFRKINSDTVLGTFAELEPDYTFVFGLSQLLSPQLLALAGQVIGTHPALLPDGRGRAALPWSIILGWAKSGISFFGLTEGIDDGLIYEQEEWPITSTDDAESLYEKMCEAGQEGLRRLLSNIASGTLVGSPQGKPQIGPLAKRTPENGKIDWHMTAGDIDRLIRATTRPYPGAFTLVGTGYPTGKVILWKSAGVADGAQAEPGTVLRAGPGEVAVMALDGAVRVREAEFAGAEVRLGGQDDFSKYFSVGERLESG